MGGVAAAGWVLLFLVLQEGPLAYSSRDLLRLSPKDYAKPDYTLYHQKSSILQAVQDTVSANPRTMKLETVQKEDKKYKSTMQVVTVEPAGLSSDHASKARVLIDYGEHAREFISAELGLRLLQVLADPAAVIRAVGDVQRGQHIVTLLDRVVFTILPMENANGRDTVERGQLCERKNGRGVDTNRNWSVDWGKKEKDYSAAEEDPGAGPFSEPETQLVLEIARAFQPHVWLNVHSGMEAMFVPWDHQSKVAPEASEALKILQTIKRDLFTSRCVVGSGGKSVGYLAHGTATDFMFQELKVPLSYTWEIYGDLKADVNDCFRMFNPIGRKEVEATIELWLKATFRLIELLPSHPAISSIFQPHSSSSSSSSSLPSRATPHCLSCPSSIRRVCSSKLLSSPRAGLRLQEQVQGY
mmetsp:Transcript_12451/g.33975  ORF Transcript_12451/g.33975 Transcript_12451/m.33975 type:complete len:413 (-) Transcript_12451:223-1461(-)